MRAHVIVTGEYAFWELLCLICGALVTESLHYAEAECEECNTRVEAQRGGGEA